MTVEQPPTARRGRPPGPTPAVRAAVDDATGAELAAAGYASFSMERVAERAAIHRSTLYRHWPTKRDLIVAFAKRSYNERLPSPDTGSWEGDLRQMIDEFASRIAEPTSLGLLRALASAGHSDPEMSSTILEVWGRDSAHHIAPIVRAQERGEVDPNLDPALLLEAISAPIVERLCVTGAPITPHFTEFTIRLIMHGARPHQPLDP